MQEKIRVLVADDSEIVREILVSALQEGGEFEVVGTGANGDEAAALTAKLRPQVITMDLHMPGSDGFAGIAKIMAETPTPILVLSSNREEIKGFRALSLGALDLVEKPALEELEAFASSLRSRLRLLASVPVIRHPRGLRQLPASEGGAGERRAELIVLGASLGGPKALAQVLAALPRDFPAPIALVQHMAEGFIAAFTRWLAQETRLSVREAVDGAPLLPGSVVVAPTDRHLRVGRGYVRLTDDAPLHGFRPSVTALFDSAAEVYGPSVCGVLLTGMGTDGSDGLLRLRQRGAQTIAQDESTCAVYGMPRAAIDLGAAEQILPLTAISQAIEKAVR